MFKNAIPFRLRDWRITAEALAEQLARRVLLVPGPQDHESRGWLPPSPDGEHLVHVVGGRYLIAMGVLTKILPAQVVRAEAARRAAEIADQQGYRPGRLQMKELREQITSELLPRAFVRPSRMLAWIDPVAGLLVVDAPSMTRAEDLLELLRQTLDTFPLALLRTRRAPAGAMADWLAGDGPAGFTVDRDCELRSITDQKAAVRYVRHALDGEDVRNHLAAGKLPIRLGMTFDDRVSFVLTERGELKRVEFLDLVKEQLNEVDTDAQALFDAGFALETGELVRLTDALVEELGGELRGAA